LLAFEEGINWIGASFNWGHPEKSWGSILIHPTLMVRLLNPKSAEVSIPMVRK